MSSKPNVLILGGCGFIGRHLVEHLIDGHLVSYIRVVDKTPPQMAWLNEKHRKIFDHPAVEFCSGNLINDSSCKNAFLLQSLLTSEEKFTNSIKHWDFVFNCAAETRSGQTSAVYNEGIKKLSSNCITESAAQNVGRYIEFSSGCMNSSDGEPIKENCQYKPWTFIAENKADIEQQLIATTNILSKLPYTILRLPIVYGKSDRHGLAPRIIIAALYKYLNEPMKLLWNESLKLNTVHVDDVVTAAWQLANSPKAIGQIYNIVDDSETTQGSLSKIFGDIFDIKIDYWGIAMSSITKLKMDEAIEEINDKHMDPWAIVCRNDGIENTPLSPYMDAELLYYKHINLDNSKLKAFGYNLKFPVINKNILIEIIQDNIKEGLFPPSLGL